MSTETKQAWTPAPWRLGTVFTTGASSRARIAIVVGPKRGRCIASVMSGGIDGCDKELASVKANACLIFKSPEMAELLRECKSYFVNRPGNHETQLNEMIGRLLADLEAK